MTIDALIFAPLTIFFMIGVCWVIGKAHRFEQEVAWSQRKEGIKKIPKIFRSKNFIIN